MSREEQTGHGGERTAGQGWVGEAVNCECGTATGEYCGATDAVVEIEWVPEYQRGTAEASGTWQGVSERLTVTAVCADDIVDDEWIVYVEKRETMNRSEAIHTARQGTELEMLTTDATGTHHGAVPTHLENGQLYHPHPTDPRGAAVEAAGSQYRAVTRCPHGETRYCFDCPDEGPMS